MLATLLLTLMLINDGRAHCQIRGVVKPAVLDWHLSLYASQNCPQHPTVLQVPGGLRIYAFGEWVIIPIGKKSFVFNYTFGEREMHVDGKAVPVQTGKGDVL